MENVLKEDVEVPKDDLSSKRYGQNVKNYL
jgi:hypothetical protein